MKIDRLNAITDGIIAIAATIMVLELDIGKTNETFYSFFEQWPTLISFFNSFFIIYIMWCNHNIEFANVKTADKKLTLLNGLWLANISLIPFVTGWVSHYPFGKFPEFLYAFIMLLCTLLFQVIYMEVGKINNREQKNERKVFLYRLPIYIGLIIALSISYVRPLYCQITVFVVAIYMIWKM